MDTGGFTTVSIPPPGRMWRAPLNRERAAISRHLGSALSRKICQTATAEIWPEAVGAPSPGPGLGGQGGVSPPPHPGHPRGFAGFTGPAADLRFCQARRHPFRGHLFSGLCGICPVGAGGEGPCGPVAEWVKPELVGHISRDATAIEGREKSVVRPKPGKPAPRKRGRPRRGIGADLRPLCICN